MDMRSRPFGLLGGGAGDFMAKALRLGAQQFGINPDNIPTAQQTVQSLLPPDPYEGAGRMVNEAARGNYMGALAEGYGSLPQTGMLAGPGAKTANLAALKEAQAMHASGASREAIFHKTAWFQGADGKWRFEIPDNNAVFDPETMRSKVIAQGIDPWKQGYAATVSDALKHRDLFKAYPDLAQRVLQVAGERGIGDAYGSYNPANGSISLDRAIARMQDEGRSTLLHELQHAIQDQEGFTPGTNSKAAFAKEYAPKLKELQQQILDVKSQIDANPQGNNAELLSRLQRLTNETQQLFANSEEIGRDLYRRNAGEVEARNVQARRNMTPDQLRASPPWMTQDVPPGRQIVPMMGLLGGGSR